MAHPSWPTFGRDVPGAAWRPGRSEIADSRLQGLLRLTEQPDLETLHDRAANDPAWFWEAAADDLAVPWQRRPQTVMDLSAGPEWARWWPGGAFNYAEAATAARAADRPDERAIAWEGDDGATRQLTNSQLRREVLAVARGLTAIGLQPGDRVGILLPMLPETAVAVLAVSLLGAIYTPIFSGYGAPAVAGRLRDCGASLLITADGYLRRGSIVALKETADAAVAEAPSVRRVVVVRRLGERLQPPWRDGRDLDWDRLLDLGARSSHAAGDSPGPAQTDPETPYMIIYTSGTTGRPKGAVHVHGGFPIKGAQDLAHGFDLRAGETLFWYTDLGWMMGPWAISGALLLGATLVLFEGVPDHPGPDRLWEIVERHRVTHLGLSPTVIRALMAHGTDPVRAHDRSSLRVLGSTGEPWNPEPWWWVFREVGGGRLPIINYSGGTEVSGGIVMCNPLTPIKPASFGGPAVGTAADVIGADGASLRGSVGELAIRQPLPGMTRGFWNDPERYLETYWSRLPSTWVHGDWAIVDEDGYWFIQGRSDDTLKIAGKRVGPAEVESAAVAHPSVLEAAAIGIPHEIKGEQIVVFCVLRQGESDDPALRAAIAARVAAELGKALKPDRIETIGQLPRTRSGKVMRRLARAAYLGLDPGDLSALENPLAVDEIRAAAAISRGR
ncbi:MAG: AMP-binding protein [Candidatus Limnocylindrales bacterium]